MLSCMPYSQLQSLDLALDILVVGLEVHPNKPKTGTSSENHLQLDSTYMNLYQLVFSQSFKDKPLIDYF